jgi:mRNA-degrading endonuclease toxin of MazEF toxin-antitoxin module
VSGKDIKVGEVYVLSDDVVSLPKNRLDRSKGIGVHDWRTVVVMQGGPSLQDPTLRTVLVAPTSSRTNLKTANDLLLSAGEGGLDKDCVCMVDHVQPVLKVDLKCSCGRLKNPRIQELQVLLAEITGGLGSASALP